MTRDHDVDDSELPARAAIQNEPPDGPAEDSAQTMSREGKDSQEGSSSGAGETSSPETADEAISADALMAGAAPDAAAAGLADAADAERPVSGELVAILEALVFASPEPILPKTLYKLLDSEPREHVDEALVELKRRYDAREGGLQLVEVAGGWQIVTRPELHEWVRRMFHERTTSKLSVQALETLAVIAYKQPITAAEITEIRGVNTSGVIGTLLERGLVKISGRKQVVGRPFLYSTTREFLDRFGLRDLNDLPKVEDMAQALGFEPPVGVAVEATTSLFSDEPATTEDESVLTGSADEDGDADGEGS